jgi:Tfp pilus assembly protein PilF
MLLLATAVFVGSQTCQPCHTALFAAYSRTPMARSSGRVESLADAEFTAAGHRYRIASNRLYFDRGSAGIDYFVGSGAAGRSFLFQREGYLFELPVSWYSRKRLWEASPGYEREPDIRLDRAVDRTCLICHASRVQPVFGTQNRYGDPPFLEDGLGCERCHGPGSEHVRNPAAVRLVNPAKLDAPLRDSVCAQCHLTGQARIERAGRRFAEFRAGQNLAEVVTYFVWNSPRADLQVTSHVEKLAASACKRASGDALWCGTCHEPHTNTDKTQSACLGCHAGAHHREQVCASCHMPKSAPSDAVHGVSTDHSIPRSARRPAQAPPRRELIAFLGAADARSLGLAYAELGDARARQYLLRAEPADAEVLLRLATLERDPKRAVSLYEAVLQADPSIPSALVNLGALYGQRGRLAEAIRLWKQALETNPAIEGAALNLAQVLPRAEATAVLERYLQFNPGSSTVRKRLGELGSDHGRRP